MVTAVYPRIDPEAPLELEADGRLFARGRRVADDEASAERAVHLVRVPRPSPEI